MRRRARVVPLVSWRWRRYDGRQWQLEARGGERLTVLLNVEHQPHLPLGLSASMGKPIPEEIQWIIVRLSAAMSREDIAMYTGVSQRKVNDVMSTFNKDGTVKVYTRQKPHTYSSLCDDDVQVSSCYSCAQQYAQASNTAPLPDVRGITRFIP